METKCFYQSPIGVLYIREENGKITNLHIQKEEENAVTAKDSMLQGNRLYRHAETGGRISSLLDEACRQLDEYFQGKRRQFDLPIGGEGTPFQQRVWGELQKIPYGETRSYEDIAAAVGNPKAQRAVGQANNRNPIIIMVPCHRVIHKNGDISGYACGIEAKKYLLELEAGVSRAV
ncbi:MAG: methylated-DNA--[protein]-cysteine S-methyltransferase [Lachnospiraceae bacterium]|nr:methylated-DNA--[protein]-cysteine S-methyltransferase [Lachnospiraceae bacterium]